MQAVLPTPAEERRETWAFLEPWCAHLRGKLGTEGRFSDHSALGEYWWVTVRLPSTEAVLGNADERQEAREIRLVREALELLALVARVDNEAWKQLLLERCSLQLDDEDDTLDGIFEPRFLFRFDGTHLRYSALLPSALCRQFFLPRPASQRQRRRLVSTDTAIPEGSSATPGYQAALQRILNLHREAGGSPAAVAKWQRVPYAIHFADLWSIGQQHLSAHLTYLLVTLDEIRRHNARLAGGDADIQLQIESPVVIDDDGNQAWGQSTPFEDDGSADGHHFAYTLESLQLCLGSIQVSRELPNVLLTMLSVARLHFSELQISLEQDEVEPRYISGTMHPRILATQHRCGMLFNTMFCGRSITTRPNDQPQGVRRSELESVVIPYFGMDDLIFSGFCASIAEASMVRKLSLNGQFHDLTSTQRTRRWQWLVYALFSGASRSSIENLELKGIHLSSADVDAIAEVLKAKVPEPGMASEAAEMAYEKAGRMVEYVTLPKETFVRMKESIGNPNETTFMDTIDEFVFRLLQDDGESDWMDVLIPGRGPGLVARDRSRKVLQDDPHAPKQPVRAEGGVSALSLSFDHDVVEGMAQLPRLLQLIGGSLRSLSIQTNGSATLDFHAILRACPCLDQLFLDSVQIDLDAFVDALEAGKAEIRCFGLAYYNASADVITRFAKKLSDPDSVLANGMHELCLSADNEEIPMADESVQAFLNVLETNRKLVYLDMLVLPALFEKYASAFRRHHQESLAVEKEKFPLHGRLAFLSVARGKASEEVTGSSALRRLDDNLLSAIFDFAAVPMKRTVCLRCDH